VLIRPAQRRLRKLLEQTPRDSNFAGQGTNVLSTNSDMVSTQMEEATLAKPYFFGFAGRVFRLVCTSKAKCKDIR